MSYDEHKQAASDIRARCAIITLSDTRTPDTDTSGQRIRELIESASHDVAAYALIPDDPQRLRESLTQLLSGHDVDVIITTGGTGISKRDNTVAVLRELLTTELPGFGELFRMLSYQQIGSGAMLSQAIGGVIRSASHDALLFALPGSTKAVELAMNDLILKELKHLLNELRR
jgi:molybdenum cofactor biosynthesis protein B